MLRVKIELVPHGIDEMTTELLTLYIGNNGKGGHSIGHYDVYEQDPRGHGYPRSSRPGWIGRLNWVPRIGPNKNRIRLAQRALDLYVNRAVED